MRGEKITIKTKIQKGADSLNNPIYEDNLVEVDNVLIAPGLSDDIFDSTRPNGVSIKYTLYLPKTFNMKIENCDVFIRDEWLKVVGSPRHYDVYNCPTSWWMVAEVGEVNG